MELRRRRAIGPVLATVILIALFIAAIAIAGFKFCLFGQLRQNDPWSPCPKTPPELVLKGYWVPHAGSLPNGTKWVDYHNCPFIGYQITGQGEYPNGTTWYTIGR